MVCRFATIDVHSVADHAMIFFTFSWWLTLTDYKLYNYPIDDQQLAHPIWFTSFWLRLYPDGCGLVPAKNPYHCSYLFIIAWFQLPTVGITILAAYFMSPYDCWWLVSRKKKKHWDLDPVRLRLPLRNLHCLLQLRGAWSAVGPWSLGFWWSRTQGSQPSQTGLHRYHDFGIR